MKTIFTGVILLFGIIYFSTIIIYGSISLWITLFKWSLIKSIIFNIVLIIMFFSGLIISCVEIDDYEE